MNFHVPRPLLLAVLLLVGLALASLSMITGKVWVPFAAWADWNNDPRWAIVFELRLPRTILGIAIGLALGISGAALQGYTRNPLADPGIMGISTMAALGAVLSLYFGVTVSMPWMLPVMAMVGAAAGVVILLSLASLTPGVVAFVLCGAILQVMAGAGVALALSLAPNPWAVNEIINWLMGSLADRSYDEVRMALPFIAAGCGLLLFLGRALDALTLGEVGARSLGIRLVRTRALLAIGVAMAAGASVAVTGAIGFVGLIVPHLLRPFVGSRPGALLLPAGLAGSALVLAADMLVRVVPSAGELKLGVTMAALGGPFFLMLLLSMRRRLS